MDKQSSIVNIPTLFYVLCSGVFSFLCFFFFKSGLRKWRRLWTEFWNQEDVVIKEGQRPLSPHGHLLSCLPLYTLPQQPLPKLTRKPRMTWESVCAVRALLMITSPLLVHTATPFPRHPHLRGLGLRDSQEVLLHGTEATERWPGTPRLYFLPT